MNQKLSRPGLNLLPDIYTRHTHLVLTKMSFFDTVKPVIENGHQD